MIIDDIRTLTDGYAKALKNQELSSYTQQVRNIQMKWIDQLHDIILEQTNRDLNGQVIQSLQTFIKSLSPTQLQYANFELPSVVASQLPNQFEYLNQDEIELLLAENFENYNNSPSNTH